MYEWVAPYPMESRDQYAQLLNLIESGSDIELDSVAADCMGFKEQGDLNDPAVTVNLRDAFNMNIQAVDAGDLAHTAEYRQPVWLGLLDSVSQEAVDYGIPAHNEHGRYMSSLIGGIACPDEDPSCLRNIHHMLAMPRSDYQLPDWTVGEDYASKVDVAVQIYATSRWRSRSTRIPIAPRPRPRAAARPRRLDRRDRGGALRAARASRPRARRGRATARGAPRR